MTAIVGKKTFSVIQIEKTKYICLPAEFVTAHKIAKGDKIEALFNGSIVYRPIRNEDIEKDIAKAKADLKGC